MAALNSQEHPEVLSRLCRDAQGTPQPDPQELHSTKPKPPPFEDVHSNQLWGCKVQDVYTKIYQTIFTDQMGKFPLRSQADNKYIVVMVEIDNSAILIKPIKNHTDAELTRAYSAIMLRLRRAGVTPRKHFLDNEISTAMKDLIQDTYKMTLELVPPGCHRRHAAAMPPKLPLVTSSRTSSANLQG